MTVTAEECQTVTVEREGDTGYLLERNMLRPKFYGESSEDKNGFFSFSLGLSVRVFQ